MAADDAWCLARGPASARASVCRPPDSRPVCCPPSPPCGPTYRQPPPPRSPGTASAFFHEAPLLIKFQGYRGDTVHVLIVESLGMTTGYPQQTGDGVFRDLHETGRGPNTTAFIEMAD